MKREIKFRGRRIDTRAWVYGNYIEKVKPTEINPTFWCCFIQDKAISMYEVIPETVSQYTGLKDKNGVEIYEGDIIKGGVSTMEVIFKQEACQFWLVWKDDYKNRYEPLMATYGDSDNYFSNNSLEVIGNIFNT